MKRKTINDVKSFIKESFEKNIVDQKISKKDSLRMEIYLKNHIVKLAKKLIESFKIETEEDFKLISKENVMVLLNDKAKDVMTTDTLLLKEAEKIKLYLFFLNIIFFKAISHKETILFKERIVICPYCNKKAVFKEAPQWCYFECADCHAKISTYQGTNIPTGLLANEELRKLRKRVHDLTGWVFKQPRWKLNLFLEKILERKFNEKDGYIGSCTKDECLRIINIFNFLDKISLNLKKSQTTRKNSYRLMHYFISNASLLELRVYYLLVKSNLSKNDIAKKLNISLNECFNTIASIFSKGGNINIKNFELIKSFVLENKNKIAQYYDDDFSVFLQNAFRNNAFPELDTISLHTAFAYFYRIKLAKKLMELSNEDFLKTKMI